MGALSDIVRRGKALYVGISAYEPTGVQDHCDFKGQRHALS